MPTEIETPECIWEFDVAADWRIGMQPIPLESNGRMFDGFHTNEFVPVRSGAGVFMLSGTLTSEQWGSNGLFVLVIDSIQRSGSKCHATLYDHAKLDELNELYGD
jgi:hypothetical protein